MEYANPSRCLIDRVIGEVTRTYELVKTQFVHSYVRKLRVGPPPPPPSPQLIVYHTNQKILLWFRNLKLTSSFETTSQFPSNK